MGKPGNQSDSEMQVLAYATPRTGMLAPKMPNRPAAVGLCLSLSPLLLLVLALVPGALFPLTLLGIVSWLVLVAPFAGIVLGIIGVRRARLPNVGGYGRAVTAIVLGAVAMAVYSLGAVVAWRMHQVYGPAGALVKIRCAQNLTAIRQDLLDYARDHNGVLPGQLGVLMTANGLDCEWLKWSGKSSSTTGGSLSYRFPGSGQILNGLPSGYVLIYEPLANHEQHGSTFLFADGTIQWKDRRAAERIIKQIEQGKNPPAGQ